MTPLSYTPSDCAFIKDAVKEILTHQSALNSMYDSNWRQNYDNRKVMFATVEEFIEMTSEIKNVVRFYGTPSQSRWDKAVEEFVDVLHFCASMALCADPDAINNLESVDTQALLLSELGSGDQLEDLYRLFLTILGIGMAPPSMVSLICVFVIGCNVFGFTPDQMLVAYLHKNKKCQARAAKGAANKDVDKSQEQGTYQYLYEKGFVSETAEEYNTRMDCYVSEDCV